MAFAAITQPGGSRRRKLSVRRPALPRLFLRTCFGAAVFITGLLDCAAAQQANSAVPETPPESAPPALEVIHPPATAAPMQPDRRRATPKSAEEAAAYQKILSEKNPDDQISGIEDFLLQYPDSELKEYVFEKAMEAYYVKSDYGHMQTYGELTLAQNPDNLTALLELSSALAETTGREDPDWEDKLNDGDEDAAHALAVLDQLHKPPGFPDERWDLIKKNAQSKAHAARGLIALIRQDYPSAVTEIKQAVELAARPDAVLLYRLGLGYSLEQKYPEAVEALDRAAALGGVKYSSGGKVRDLVAEARELAARGMASSPAPAEAKPAPLPAASPAAAPAATPSPANTPPGSQAASPAEPEPSRVP